MGSGSPQGTDRAGEQVIVYPALDVSKIQFVPAKTFQVAGEVGTEESNVVGIDLNASFTIDRNACIMSTVFCRIAAEAIRSL